MAPASRPLVFATNPIHPRAERMIRAEADFVVASRPTPDKMLAEAREAAVIIVRAALPAELFDAAPRLRAAVRHGAGLDMIPLEVATRAGVLVANVPAVNARTVAEHVIMVTLALLRRFRSMDRDLRGEGWAAGRAHADHANDLAGRRLGIVGMGNVGRAVSTIARHGFGLDVAAHTRSPGRLPGDIRALGIDELVAQSDVVVLSCPLTPETTGLMSRERIARMKPGAILVNVSRGPVVDEAALVDALETGRLGGAALDVFAAQPLPRDHRLFGFDNVILSPHMAGITEESMLRMGEGAAREVLRVLAGELPLNLRNPEAVERHRQRFPAPVG